MHSHHGVMLECVCVMHSLYDITQQIAIAQRDTIVQLIVLHNESETLIGNYIHTLTTTSNHVFCRYTYCDMTTDEGGWHLVWKHSYLQVSPLTIDMFYNSSFYKPCTDLSVGWCNVPNKTRLQPEEMMIAAYHNGILVYAYKGTFNRNIDHHWTGATLLTPVTQIVDHCRYSSGVPAPFQYRTLTGLIFAKEGDEDTIRGTLDHPSEDDRWEECRLPSSISSSSYHTQMTMAIYVR